MNVQDKEIMAGEKSKILRTEDEQRQKRKTGLQGEIANYPGKVTYKDYQNPIRRIDFNLNVF